MSDFVQYKVWVVRQFLANRMDLGLFAQNLGGIYTYARERPTDGPANSLAGDLMHPYAQFSGGFVSEDYLRRELAVAIRPFEILTDPITDANHVHNPAVVR